jgi:phosphatidylglycerophosphate synthase
MVDDFGRRVKDALLDPVLQIIPAGVHPNSVSLVSLLPGVATAVLAAFGLWPWAICAFALNRVLDGLDGLLARGRGLQSDFGGYLDIMIDFVVYAAIPIGVWVGVEAPIGRFALDAGMEATAETLPRTMALVVLLAVFYVNGASWMYLSAVMEKRSRNGDSHIKTEAASPPTSVTMPSGLVEGTETVLFYFLFLLFPNHYPVLFYLMAAATAVGIVQRIGWAIKHLR